MPPDHYKVEIVYFLNPHLIWVVVRDPSVHKDDHVLEQVGVYGVLPLEKTLDIVAQEFISQKCEKWLPAAGVVIKDLMDESDEAWFSPTHIDRRTSIFDDNIHKYGEIIFKTKKGKLKKLSKQLIKSGFAYNNICEFHEKLSCGKLNVKLNAIKTKEVIKELENYSLQPNSSMNNLIKSVEKQTSVFQLSQNFESCLSESNLEKHNNEIIKQTLINKFRDFELCKDVEEQSVGRAYRRIKTLAPESDTDVSKSQILARKLSTSKKISDWAKTENSNLSYNDITKYLGGNLNVKDMIQTDESQSSSENNVSFEADAVVSTHKKENMLKGKLQYFRLQKSRKSVDSTHNEQHQMKSYRDKTSKDEFEHFGNQFEDKPSHVTDYEEQTIPTSQPKEKSSISRIQTETPDLTNTSSKTNKKPIRSLAYRNAATIRVAYGPPEVNPQLLKIQVKSALDYDEESSVKQKVDVEKFATSQKRDCMYDDVDSELGFELTSENTFTNSLNNIGNANNDIRKTEYEKSIRRGIGHNLKFKNYSNDETQNTEKNADINDINNSVEISNTNTVQKENFIKNNTGLSCRRDSVDKYDKKKIVLERVPVKSDLESNNSDNSVDKKTSLLMKRRSKAYHTAIRHNNSFTSSDTSNKDSSSDLACNKKPDDNNDNIEEIIEWLNLKNTINKKLEVESTNDAENATKLSNNVNPFKNIDPNISIFVDKLVTPVLMVHTKHDKRIEPVLELRDMYFNSHTKNVLRNMLIETPMMLQSISWFVILRGYSLFMISPVASGKTLGYLPAVCRLVSDSSGSGGPVCIIVCATAQSVTNVEKMAKMFLKTEERVLACYAGVEKLHITTTLLNGCDLLVATPSFLIRLLQDTDFGVDLRRLTTFVLDDCERLLNVYADEIKFFTRKINEMLKARAEKHLKVQYILASRIWCDYMEPLAKKVPDTVICIGAFQECVLYSKTNTSVTLVKKDNKIDCVFGFLKDIDASKKTVVVCQSNEEVAFLEKALKRSKHTIFTCNNDMTIHDLYNLSVSWADYKEPMVGPILICCDGNLAHMNITDAHNLIHYSMPSMFSLFCKRFSVLNDNYPSIFKENNENVKLKILLEESNVEQLPKILNFIKRCTDNVPSVLDEISSHILKQKDVIKAEKFYPLCDNLLCLGYCPDVYNCKERHTILKDYDAPKDWLPKEGTITCKILYYHSATLYSARIMSCTVDGKTIKYPQTYNKLFLKMSMYYSKESNKKLHGIPEIGDICATSVKLHSYARCQVLKILNRYERGTPNHVLVKLIDEERLEVTRDIYLYYLPDELKEIESRVVQVILANIEPKDKDITFSKLARERLKKITDTDTELFVRGQVSLTLGNCIFVSTLEACQDLTSMNEVVVKYNLKQELLENHANLNPDHLSNLKKMVLKSGLVVKEERHELEPEIPIKNLSKCTWAHLERESLSSVYFASAINPDKFFVRLAKFESCMTSLLHDIKKYVDANSISCDNVKEGDLVLAKFPDDNTYERARIDDIKEELAKCFFVDQGDWREIPLNDLTPMTERFITQLPFQAIECRLVGIRPSGEQWTDFSTNWFINSCHDKNGDLKYLYVTYFNKDSAEFTNGFKYNVAIIDTSTKDDVIINQLMIEFNLANKNLNEIMYLDNIEINKLQEKLNTDSENDNWEEAETSSRVSNKVPEIDNIGKDTVSPHILFKTPIRSVPLVNSDNESDDSDKWDVNIGDDCLNLIPALNNVKSLENSMPKVNTDNTMKSERDSKTADVVELDSDDLTSPDDNFESTVKPIIISKTKESKTNPFLKMDGETNKKQMPSSDSKTEVVQKRRPKLVWRQNKTSVTIKIQLIGADNYELSVEDRLLVFSADVNDTDYGFKIELYGVIDKEKCSHVNKGQYILVKLKKISKTNWLTLTLDGEMRKWIVYDVDNLDTSSEEESTLDNFEPIVRNIYKDDTETDEEEFDDDINWGYKK